MMNLYRKLIRLLVIGSLAALVGCGPPTSIQKYNWTIALNRKTELAGFELFLDGKAVPSVRDVAFSENSDWTNILRFSGNDQIHVRLVSNKAVVIESTVSYRNGNVIAISQSKSDLILSQAHRRDVQITRRTANEIHAEFVMSKDDNEFGQSVYLEIPEVESLLIKVPTNQGEAILRVNRLGRPTWMIHQLLPKS